MRAILIATDGSQSASEALHFAIDLARESSAELHVVSVRPRTYHGRGGPAVPVTQIEEVHGAELIAEAAAAEARAAGLQAQAHVAHGDEATQIANAAEELDVDLVVVGSHGRGTVGAALLRERLARARAALQTARHGRPQRARAGAGAGVRPVTALVTAASRHGATYEIADAIGRTLAERGLDVRVVHAEDVGAVDGYDAVVLGSAGLRRPLAGAGPPARRGAPRRAGTRADVALQQRADRRAAAARRRARRGRRGARGGGRGA